MRVRVAFKFNGKHSYCEYLKILSSILETAYAKNCVKIANSKMDSIDFTHTAIHLTEDSSNLSFLLHNKPCHSSPVSPPMLKLNSISCNPHSLSLHINRCSSNFRRKTVGFRNKTSFTKNLFQIGPVINSHYARVLNHFDSPFAIEAR